MEEVSPHSESPLELILLLAIARSDRVDLAVRQATELVVKKIVLFFSARTPYRIEKSRIWDKVSRWDRIAREAVCQCKRVVPPTIDCLGTIGEALEFVNMNILLPTRGLRIVATENYNGRVYDLGYFAEKVKRPSYVAVAVGPEGGWTMEEVNLFGHFEWNSLSLGPRILRYETAVVAVLSLCQFLWGDMRLTKCPEETIS
jgi:16S rRNA (uracil1498-N3)-methyltransferase